MDSLLKGVILELQDQTYVQADIYIENGIIAKIDGYSIKAKDISPEQFLVTCGFVNSHLHPNQLFDRRLLDGLPITHLLSAMHKSQKKDDVDRYYQAIFVLIDALRCGATSAYAVAYKLLFS